MDVNATATTAELVRKGLRLALLYSAAVALFLGALGGAITLALGGAKPMPVIAPTNAVTPSDTAAAPKGRTVVPSGDNHASAKSEI